VHSAVSHAVRREIKPRFASNSRILRASPPRQPMPETTTEESITATGFTSLLFHARDDFHDLDDWLATRGSVFLQLFKFSAEINALLFLLATDKISDHIAGGGEALLLLSGFQPCQLAWSQRNIH